MRDFRHEGQQVAVGIAKERHPQVVIGQARNQRRIALERHAAGGEFLLRLLDGGDLKVEDRVAVLARWIPRR